MNVVYDEEARRAYELLVKNGSRVTTAESCTGGLLGASIVMNPGASDVFDEGYLTYANEAKMKLLGVREETLKTVGAVSEQCAMEMAQGALNASDRSDYALSVTGIAGPTGGSAEKPVGTVWIGLADRDSVYARRFLFDGDRSAVRCASVKAALTMLIEHINGNE